MAHYQVYWHKAPKEAPRASHWYTLGGVIVWASPVLSDWVGRRHGDLVRHLWHNPKPLWWIDEAQRSPVLLDDHCVPPTLKYHKQLMQCLEALLKEEP